MGNVSGATHSVRNVPTNISETFLRNVGFGGRDAFLPSVPSLTQYGLPGNRKQLIKKIVSLRFDKLTELKCKDCKTYT
jgi:hypothetical protein